MPKMNWEEFQHDHHRPHLLVASVDAKKASDALIETLDLERLAVTLKAAANYAFKVEGTTLYAAFEDEGDAERFAAVFRPKQMTGDSDWTSKAWARLDDATLRRIANTLAGARLRTNRRMCTP